MKINKFKDFIKKKSPKKNSEVKSLFPLKDEGIYSACKIYHGLCSCKEKYADD